jgi:hypothetical protein
MASDGTTGQIPVASLVQGSQATSISPQSGGGKSLPQTGKIATARVSSASDPTDAGGPSINKAPVQNTTDPQSLVNQLNRYLNDSGRPDQFRLDPASNGKMIQQVNPASGAVIGEFSAAEFPALARSVGATGLLIDSLA